MKPRPAGRLLVACALVGCTAADAAAQRAGITGRVLDAETGSPLAGAEVEALGTGRATTTNEAGYFSLLGLEAGELRIGVTLLGYAQRREVVSLASGQVLELEIRLAMRPVELGAITVKTAGPSLAPWLLANGFGHRRAEGRGLLHFTRRDLRFQAGSDLADVIRRVPGARIRRLVNGGSELLIEPSPHPDGRPCRVGIYLNGSAVELGRFDWTGVRQTQRASRPLRFDDLLRLDQVDGVELYGAEESPVASEEHCGALLLWSAELRAAVDEPLTGAVEGTVSSGSGQPIGNARVTLQPLGLAASSGPDGTFAFDDVAPGTYEVLVEVDSLPAWRTDLDVKAFAVVKLDVRVGSGPEGTARLGAQAGFAAPEVRGACAAASERPCAARSPASSSTRR